MPPKRVPSRVLVLGCGSVAQCTLPLMIRDLRIDPRCIRVVDMIDNRSRIADSIASGVCYEQDRVTPENIDAFLSTLLAMAICCSMWRGT